MDTIQMDFIANGQAVGQVANMFQTNGKVDPGMLRPFVGRDGKVYVTVYTGGNPKDVKSYKTQPIMVNATLRRDEWKQLDDVLLPIAENRMAGINDLVEKNLTFNLGNALGTTVLEWHDVSDAMSASLSMDGVSRSKGDRPEYTTKYLPIPIIHSDYEINSRVLAASRSLGNALDTTSAERAARKVAEKLESMLFTDKTYSFGGGSIYSYLNFPTRGLHVLDKAWNASNVTGKEIVQDVLDMKQTSIDNFHYGPWMLYIPTAYETAIDADYADAKGDNTIRDRIMKISGITGIKTIDTLPENTVLLVQMTSDVVRLVRGMGIQNIQWQTEGQFITKFKVITIQVPQIRGDQDGKTGIVHASTA